MLNGPLSDRRSSSPRRWTVSRSVCEEREAKMNELLFRYLGRVGYPIQTERADLVHSSGR